MYTSQSHYIQVQACYRLQVFKLGTRCKLEINLTESV